MPGKAVSGETRTPLQRGTGSSPSCPPRGGIAQALMPTLALLTLSNIFMTIAWYWHLKGGPAAAEARPLGWVILTSWLIAGVEYTLAVPANRLGYESGWSPAQLKIAQEAIALTVFGVFMVVVLGQPMTWRYMVAFGCIMAAVGFMFIGR
jgi:uncharacterized protein (DUF486 family)